MIKKKLLCVPCQWYFHLPRTHVDANVQVIFVMFLLKKGWPEYHITQCMNSRGRRDTCRWKWIWRTVMVEHNSPKRMLCALHAARESNLQHTIQWHVIKINRKLTLQTQNKLKHKLNLCFSFWHLKWRICYENIPWIGWYICIYLYTVSVLSNPLRFTIMIPYLWKEMIYHLLGWFSV